MDKERLLRMVREKIDVRLDEINELRIARDAIEEMDEPSVNTHDEHDAEWEGHEVTINDL